MKIMDRQLKAIVNFKKPPRFIGANLRRHYFWVFLASMYVLKIKGTAKIPDYVQLRDDAFSLISYFRLDRPEKALAKNGLADKQAQVIEFINTMPFGKVLKLEL